MISAARFFGGARKVDVGTDETHRIHPEVARIWALNATGTGSVAELPDTRTIVHVPEGSRILIVANVGSESVDVVDQAATVITAVAPGEIASLALADRSANAFAGEWAFHVEDLE
jgi:hypothetical protein